MEKFEVGAYRTTRVNKNLEGNWNLGAEAITFFGDNDRRSHFLPHHRRMSCFSINILNCEGIYIAYPLGNAVEMLS
jgi:hypothetical protein